MISSPFCACTKLNNVYVFIKWNIFWRIMSSCRKPKIWVKTRLNYNELTVIFRLYFKVIIRQNDRSMFHILYFFKLSVARGFYVFICEQIQWYFSKFSLRACSCELGHPGYTPEWDPWFVAIEKQNMCEKIKSLGRVNYLWQVVGTVKDWVNVFEIWIC